MLASLILYSINFIPTLTLSQCILAGQCTLECHLNATNYPVYTGISLGHPANTCRVHRNTTGKKLSWNSPTLECHWRNLVESTTQWDATRETLLQPTLEHHWRDCDSPHMSRHIELSMQSSIHANLKWQDGGTPVGKGTCLCIFSLYLEFTALQWMPVLLLKHVSTATLLCACLWYKHYYGFCVFGVASQMKSV